MTARTPGTQLIRLVVSALVASLTTSGCAWFQSDINRGYAEKGHWDKDEPRVYTTADVRMVTRRRHPQTGQEVTCTEPTPDIAKALSTASAFTAKGGSNAGASGEIGASGGSAEAVAELAGRSTALIALRDGLFRTCEAYVNGAIGSDAYALVLSRYGQLMTTLFLGEDIRGAAALSNSPLPVSPNLINVTPAAGSNTQIAGPTSQTQKGGTDGTASPSPGATTPSNGKGKNTSGTVNAAPELLKVVNGGDPASTSGAGSNTGVAPSPPPAAGASDSNSSSAAAAKQKPSGASSDNSGSSTTQPAKAAGGAPSTTSPSAVAAVSLVRMNEDYFDLDVNFMHQLVVACINEFDPTRVRMRVSDTSGSPAGELQNLLDIEKARVQRLEESQQNITQEQEILKQAQQLVGQMQQLQESERQLEGQLAQVRSNSRLRSGASSSEAASGSASPQPSAALSSAIPEMPSLQSVVGENPFLRRLCTSLASVNRLVTAENELLPTFSKAGHPAADVQPDLGLISSSTPPADDSHPKTAAPEKNKSNPGNSTSGASRTQQSEQSQSHSQQSQPPSGRGSKTEQQSSPQQAPPPQSPPQGPSGKT